MRHRYAVFNWLQASFRMAQVVSHHVGALGPGGARAPLDGRGRRDGLERRDARGRRLRHHGAALGRDRGLRRRRGHPALGRRSCSASSSCIGVPVLVLLLGFVIKPLQARQRGSARGGRQADRARRRHRRRAARAARDRRRAGVLRPLPPPLAGGPARRRPRRAAAVDARRGAGLRPGTLRRARHLARRALRGLGDRSTPASSSRSTATPRSSSSRCEPPRRRSTRSRARSSAPGGCWTCSTSSRTSPSPSRPPPSRRRACRSRDARSGLVVEPGLADLHRLVAARRGRGDRRPARALRRRRTASLLGDVPLADLPIERRAPADRRQRGRSGALLRDAALRARPVGPRGGRRAILDAISVANAEDVLEALPEGLDATSTSAAARSRAASASGSCSPARCSSDAEVLVLVEPTSAVDAHTEARIARRLREARAGRTTVIVTDEPARARPGRPRRRSSRTAASSPRAGTASCCARPPDYRETVTRGEDAVSELLPIADGPELREPGAAARAPAPAARSPA